MTEADDKGPDELSGMSGLGFLALFQGYNAISAVGVFKGNTKLLTAKKKEWK